MNYNAPHAFVAVNYVPKLGLFWFVVPFLFYIAVVFVQINFPKINTWFVISHVPSGFLGRPAG
jgi:hypothetical protein